MAKRRPQKPAEEEPTLTTYSIRLDERDAALLRRALDLKGWSATHFIRKAAIERAVHVINTTAATDLDFTGMARRIAKQICEPEVMFGMRENPEEGYSKAAEYQAFSPYDFGTDDALKPDELPLFKEVARKGGSEFLAQVLAECDRLRPGRRVPTIDPEDF
jgi:uncharacterized protein (DUF1778 family)